MAIKKGETIKVRVGSKDYVAVAVSDQKGETIEIQLTVSVKDLPPMYNVVEVTDDGDTL